MVCHNLIGNIFKKSFSGYITVHPTIHAILDKKKCGVTMPILQIRQLRLRAGKETHSGRDTAWVGGRGLRRIPSRRGPCPPSHRPVSRGLRQVRSSCPQDILQQPRGKGTFFCFSQALSTCPGMGPWVPLAKSRHLCLSIKNYHTIVPFM